MSQQAHHTVRNEVPASAPPTTVPPSFLRSVAVVLGGSAGAQAAALIAVPLLTRLYRPDHFGALSVFVAVVSLALPILALRYDMAIAVAESPAERSALVRVAVLTTLATTACMTAVVLVLARLHPGSAFGVVRPHVEVLAVSLLAAGVSQTFTAFGVSTCLFTGVGRSRIYQALAQIGVQVIGGVAHLGSVGLLAGDAFGRIASAFPLVRASLARPPGNRVSLRGVAKRFATFSLVSSLSAALNGAGLYIPALGFAAVFGTTAAGWFALSQRVTAIPMGLLGAAVAQVYLGHASQIVKSDLRRCLLLYREVRRRLLRVGVAAALAIVGGAYAFEFVFGRGWAEAGVYCQLLAPGIAAQFVGSPLSQTLTLLGKLKVQGALDAVRVVLVVAALVALPPLGATPRVVVAALSGVAVLHYGVLLVVTERALHRATLAHSKTGAQGCG